MSQTNKPTTAESTTSSSSTDLSIAELQKEIRTQQKQKNVIQNTEALENSRMQSVLNNLVFDMQKYTDGEKQYNELKPKVEAAKKATADKLAACDKKIEEANKKIAAAMAEQDKKITESIAKAANKSASEPMVKFQGQTPDQFTDEQGKKGFQNEKGQEPKEEEAAAAAAAGQQSKTK